MIIGITGTLGAGKGTVVEYLKTKGFTHYSVRDFLNEEIVGRGLISNRDVMLATANDLRAMHGAGYIAEQLMERASKSKNHAVIESVRSVGEAEYIRERGGVLWAVDADIKTRYGRITKRMSETDKVSFEKFQADEAAEFTNIDASKPNLKKLIEMADAVFQNNGSQAELYQQVEAALQKAAV